MVVARGRAQQTISIMAKHPQALHLFGTFSEVLHGVPSKALRNEVDGTLAQSMEGPQRTANPCLYGWPGGPGAGAAEKLNKPADTRTQDR